VRLFVAVNPPEPALAHLAGAVAGLHLGRAASVGLNVRLTPRERWHLTVAFLGDVEPDRLPDAQDALGKAVAGWQEPAPRLRLAGGGRFGRGRFTILWAGTAGDVVSMTQLAGSVRRQLKRARVPFDHKPFRPHLTLARPGDRLSPTEVAADLAVLRAYQGPFWTVAELRLVRSHLGPNPVHETVAEFALSGG
jgi:RNA 2',3'-cyclic 3'-phosphodiesterase